MATAEYTEIYPGCKIYKRPDRKGATANSNWWLRLGEKKPYITRTLGTKDFEKAKALAQEAWREAIANPQKRPGFTIEDLVEKYLRDKGLDRQKQGQKWTHKQRVLINYLRKITQYVGNTKLAAITQTTEKTLWEGLIHQLAEHPSGPLKVQRTLSPTTARFITSAYRQLISWGYEQGLVNRLPAPVQRKTTTVQRKHFTPQQQKALFDKLNPSTKEAERAEEIERVNATPNEKWRKQKLNNPNAVPDLRDHVWRSTYYIARLLRWTGCRPGEIYNLRWSDTERNEKFEFRDQPENPDFEPEEEGLVSLIVLILHVTGKTNKSKRRAVVVRENGLEVIAELMAYCKRRLASFNHKRKEDLIHTRMTEGKPCPTDEELKATEVGLSDTYLFASHYDPREPMDATQKSYVIAEFRTALEQLNLYRDQATGQTRSLYSLRHTFITRSLEDRTLGGDIYLIARHCGTSVGMIEKHYAHIHDEAVRDLFLKKDSSSSFDNKSLANRSGRTAELKTDAQLRNFFRTVAGDFL